MIEQLFGSRTRIKLLKIFLAQPYEKFFIRELTRKIGERINSVRREIANLEKLGAIIHEQVEEERKGSSPRKKKKGAHRRAQPKAQVDKRKFYRANTDFVLFEELKSLVFKSQLLVGKSLTDAVQTLGKVKLLLLAGFFVGDMDAETDLLVVGSIHKPRLMKLLKQLERSFGHEVNYTLMSAHEYRLRMAMTDKFLYKILEGKKMVLVQQDD